MFNKKSIVMIVMVSSVTGIKAATSRKVRSNIPRMQPTLISDNTPQIVPVIRTIDPDFSAEHFIGFTKEVFIT
jgi:hypothetical protein